jgi:hypothetical protein
MAASDTHRRASGWSGGAIGGYDAAAVMLQHMRF